MRARTKCECDYEVKPERSMEDEILNVMLHSHETRATLALISVT